MNKEQIDVSDFVFEILKFKCFLKSIIAFEKLNASIIFNVVEYGVCVLQNEAQNEKWKISDLTP